MAAVVSRKQPTNSISRLASSRNTQGSRVKPSTHCEMAAVTPVAVSIQPKMLAAATMSSTVDVVSTGLRGANLDEWRALVRISFLVDRVTD